MDKGEEAIGDKTRIYVGGLGAGVTENDLRQTFSALGEVVSVDVVRTKGRSFAYLDFLPASEKSLPKLFSTYNGCMWKGGKLKLEKAKEHYLVKLKREWQQESEYVSKASDNCNADESKNHDTLEKPKKPSPVEKTQIQLFFPKLGKVKSLAQVGIGKHKYSFQRIQVPPIPTHFCDCEEHSIPFSPPNRKQSSEIVNASYEINEQELNIMNSVMNKIFQRANPSNQVIEKSEFTNAKDELVVAENDEEDHVSDEDNLIINVANRKNDNMDLFGEMRAMMANQEPVAKKLNTSTTKKPNSVNDKLQKKTASLTKKRKSSNSEETSRNSPTRLDIQENSKKEVKSVTKESGNNSLRSLKSTWKDLIGQKRDTSFNISNFIASLPQKKEDNGDDYDDNNHPVKSKDLVNNKKRKLEEELNADTVGQQFMISDDVDQKEEFETDDLDCNFEEHENDQDLKKPDSNSQVKNDIMISDVVAGDVDQKEEKFETDDLDCNFEEHENNQDLKKPDTVKNDEDLIKKARGEFWRHKLSWTQLINTANHTSFSISQMNPDINSGKHEQQQLDTFVSQPVNKNLDDQIAIAKKEAKLSPVKKNIPDKKRILSLVKLESDDTCPFMRTDESVKEWKKIKGSLNKKKRLANS